MLTPAFWNKPPSVLSTLLSPLAALWTIETRRRLRKTGVRVSVPVICVGNLTAGGTGKTPVVIRLTEYFARTGIAAHVVSRGYGGALSGPARVDERLHSAADVGDEPLLVSAFAPCWVAKDRIAGAQAAIAGGAEAVILDDGFQNPGLQKSLSFVVVDAAVGFGNGRVIPAGPLREPVADGLARADAIILIGPEAARASFRTTLKTGLPVIEGTLEPLQTGMDWDGLRVSAFAGIGRPQKFFDTLKAAGAEIVETHSFGDHAPYRRDLLTRLIRDAAAKEAQLVTTEKDAVRLPVDLRSQVLAFPVRLQLDHDELDALIQLTVKN